MQQKLSIIVARSQNNAIGLAGSIPWICPEDMRYFKEKTSGHICLAGFNTYRTLPEDGLPNRLLYVLTQKPLANRQNVFFIKSLDEFWNAPFCGTASSGINSDEVFCIGGLSLYTSCLPFVSKIYLTEIKKLCNGDTFFTNNFLIGFNSKILHETEKCIYYVYERMH